MRKTKYHNQIPMKEILECVQDKVEEEEGTGASKKDLLSWLAKYKAQMVVYEARLRCNGRPDTLQSLKLMTANDMADLNILPGHRPLLVDALDGFAV